MLRKLCRALLPVSVAVCVGPLSSQVSAAPAPHGAVFAPDSSTSSTRVLPKPAREKPSAQQDSEAIGNLALEGRAFYQQDDPKLPAEKYCDRAVALAEGGQFRESIRAASRVLYLGFESKDENLIALGQRDLAIAYNYAGDLDHASQYANGALALKASKIKVYAPAYKILGDVSIRRGDLPLGIDYYKKSLAFASERFRPLVQISLGNAYVQTG